jgi:hypothetical protein
MPTIFLLQIGQRPSTGFAGAGFATAAAGFAGAGFAV